MQSTSNQSSSNQSSSNQSTSIDMFTPAQACESLGLNESAILDLVNAGRLAAYRIGDHIRFRISDVQAASKLLMIAGVR